MKTRKLAIFTLSLGLILFLSINSTVEGQSNEIKFSPELDTGDKYQWEILEYLDDGVEVNEEQKDFGRIVDSIIIEFSIEVSPTTADLFGDSNFQDYIDIFKITAGSKLVSQPENIGILSFFIMPTIYELSTGESKNYIHDTFSTLGATITTSDKLFTIHLENQSMVFHNNTIDIQSWDLVINKNTGVMINMQLLGMSSNNNLELNIGTYHAPSDDGFLPINFEFMIVGIITLGILRKRNIKQIHN